MKRDIVFLRCGQSFLLTGCCISRNSSSERLSAAGSQADTVKWTRLWFMAPAAAHSPRAINVMPLPGPSGPGCNPFLSIPKCAEYVLELHRDLHANDRNPDIWEWWCPLAAFLRGSRGLRQQSSCTFFYGGAKVSVNNSVSFGLLCIREDLKPWRASHPKLFPQRMWNLQ